MTVNAKHQANINLGVNIFEKEEQAISLLMNLVWVMPVVVHAGSLLDVILTILFQKYFHPWRRILKFKVI